jgi:pimeloyl-ACP methyl ester carboxylesterase
VKFINRLLLVSVVTIVVFVFAGLAATWAPDKTVQELQTRWGEAPSVFINVGGLDVHLRDEGPRNDPLPLILLHGTSDSLHTWQEWTTRLKDKHRIIRMDLPAFGLTGPTASGDYSIEAYSKFVMDLADTLGVPSFALGGNSLGGQIAWAVAAAHPERVKKLILIDAAGYELVPESIPIGFRIAKAPGVRSVMDYVLPRGLVESSVRNVYARPERVTAALVDRYYDLTLREGNRKALTLRFDAQQKEDKVKDRGTIRSLKVPTLILWGAKDRLIPIDHAQRFKDDIEGSTLVIFDDVGHLPQQEDAARTVGVVQQFLK